MVTFLQTLRHTAARHPALQKALLGCGVAAASWWVAMDVIGSLRYPGYSYADQTISELSAQGAPTRTFMFVASGIPYGVLLMAFGAGIWLAASERRAGRVTGALVAGEAVFGVLGGLLFPMATREVIAAGEDTLRNQIHGPYGIGMPVFFVLIIGFAATLLGKRFRWYSYATIVIMLVSGLLMGMQNAQLAANEPTPWMGIEERVTAYAPMVWFVVLALALLRAQPVSLPRRAANPAPSPLTLSR